MKNEALYNKTVSILVDAYFNDTLVHGNCYACAVGNIVAGNCGYSFGLTNEYGDGDGIRNIGWENFSNISDTLTFYIASSNNLHLEQGRHFSQLKATGYSFDELRDIERAFESVTQKYSYEPKKCQTKEESMFNGLMAVIDCLDLIHENTDIYATASTKQKFVKQTA